MGPIRSTFPFLLEIQNGKCGPENKQTLKDQLTFPIIKSGKSGPGKCLLGADKICSTVLNKRRRSSVYKKQLSKKWSLFSVVPQIQSFVSDSPIENLCSFKNYLPTLSWVSGAFPVREPHENFLCFLVFI